MNLTNQINKENTIETISRLYVSLIKNLSNTGVYFKSHTLKLLDADKYLTNNKCTICIEEYDDITAIRMLNCRHIFHLKCIERFLEEKNECALCRTEVKNCFDYSSMSVYISSLKLQCCQPDCFYFATQNSIKEAQASIASIINSFPDDDAAYGSFDTNLESTTDDKEYNSFLANELLKECNGKKQQLLIKLFSNMKKFYNNTEQKVLSSIDHIEKQLVFYDKSFLGVDSCPYPENTLKNKKPDNFFCTYYSMISNYIYDSLLCHLPFGCNIRNIKYSYEQAIITLNIIINDISFSFSFNEEKITSKSNTAIKCLHVMRIFCNNAIKLCKIFNKYQTLLDKSNNLHCKNIELRHGLITLSYNMDLIYIDYDEFSPNPNDLSIDFASFINALEKNGIDSKYLLTQ